MSTTIFLVMHEFGSAEIPLEKVCEEHFAMKLEQAKRKAAAHDLPVPFYKKTGKSGYFCSASDWAQYIDDQSATAREQWKKMRKAG